MSDVEELAARVARLETAHQDVELVLETSGAPGAKGGTGNGAGTAPDQEFAYPNVEAWVGEWVVAVFARRRAGAGAIRWCPQWWAHPEAVVRLEGLWRAWEVLRRDPNLGMATWLRDHFDPQWRILTGDTGPFLGCEGDKHHVIPDLPVTAAPEGYWTPMQKEGAHD